MIEIYGIPTCTYCKRATEFCEAAGLEYKYTCLVKEPDEYTKLEEKIGRFRSVPQIIVDGTHVGGYDSFIEAAKNG